MELTKLHIKPLSGLSEWPIWKRRLRDFLDYHEGALNVIDGTLVKPEPLVDAPTEEQRKQFKEQSDLFRKANSYAKSIITSALTEDTYQKVMDKETAREVWEELKRNFEASSKDQLFRICSDFFSFSWTLADDVSIHVAKLKTLWNELNSGLQAKGETKLPEMMLICKILHILPGEYQSFKSSWMLLSDEKQTVEELVTQLCSFGRDIKSGDVSRANQEALVLKSVKPQHQPQKPKVQKKTVKGNCNYCHAPGHWVRNCAKWIADGKPRKNPVTTNTRENSGTSNVLTACAEAMTAENCSDWFVDNGATQHVTNQSDIFVSFHKFDLPHTVTVAGGKSIPAVGKGTVEVLSFVGNRVQKLQLTDVWYVPKIGRNLFSVLAAQDRNPQTASFKSSSTECWLTINGNIAVYGTRRVNGTLYRVHMQAVQSDAQVQANVATDCSSTLQLYHERFGHQNRRHVQTVIKRELGIDVKLDKDQFCEECVYGKAHRLKFGTRENAARPGELMSADVCGPFDESFRKYRYFVVFKDHYSKLRFIAFLRNKSDVAEALKDMLAKTKNEGHVIKELLSDNGGEFDNDEVRSILRANGITQRLTAPYSPEQNGVVERENRTIVEMARTLKYSKPDVEYPAGMWAELCQTAVYILNRTAKSSEEDKTPMEVWTGKKPRIRHLRVIGSVCYAHIPDCRRHKMDKKAVKGYLVGYDGDERYRIYIKKQHRVILSRDVVFQEKSENCKESVELPVSDVKSSSQEIESEVEQQEEITPDGRESHEEQDELTGRELRDRSLLAKPKKFDDYVTTAEAFLTEISEPESYEEAVTGADREHWNKAMKNEIDSLAKNQTWQLTDLPDNMDAIPCKWVFRLKTNPDGSIEKYKARLVVKGFNQRKGEDYNQTFSPVARLATIRSVLSIAASERMYLKQFDVSTAFLYGELDETVYMQQPRGYTDGSSRVCKLLKSLYGLKQSPRCWNKRIEAFLRKQGFKVSAADPCLYIRDRDGKKLLLALYVDDGILAATDMQDLNSFISQLRAEFDITVKDASYFLGVEIEKEADGSIKISQPAYARRILERFKFENCKASATPMVKITESDSAESGKVDATFPYRQAVGALMFLMTGTRPDLAFSVGYLSRVLDKPTTDDVIRVKRVFRYLAGTIAKGIVYKPDCSPGTLECYSDADFGGCSTTGRSTSGVVVCHAGGTISWLSQRQAMVATSTTESEIIAATEAAKEVIWLERLFCDVLKLKHRPVLQVDNSAAVKLAQNPEFHRRTKHIDVKHFFVREKVIDGSIDIIQISTEHQVADVMTKPLDRVRLIRMCDRMGLV